MGGSFLIHSLQCCRARRLREAHTNFTLLFPTASGKAISAPKQSQLVVSSGAQRVLSGAAGEAELWALRKPKRPIILSDAKNQTPPPSQPMGACPCARHLRPALNRALCPPTFSPYNIDKKKKKKAVYTPVPLLFGCTRAEWPRQHRPLPRPRYGAHCWSAGDRSAAQHVAKDAAPSGETCCRRGTPRLRGLWN